MAAFRIQVAVLTLAWVLAGRPARAFNYGEHVRVAESAVRPFCSGAAGGDSFRALLCAKGDTFGAGCGSFAEFAATLPWNNPDPYEVAIWNSCKLRDAEPGMPAKRQRPETARHRRPVVLREYVRWHGLAIDLLIRARELQQQKDLQEDVLRALRFEAVAVDHLLDMFSIVSATAPRPDVHGNVEMRRRSKVASQEVSVDGIAYRGDGHLEPGSTQEARMVEAVRESLSELEHAFRADAPQRRTAFRALDTVPAFKVEVAAAPSFIDPGRGTEFIDIRLVGRFGSDGVVAGEFRAQGNLCRFFAIHGLYGDGSFATGGVHRYGGAGAGIRVPVWHGGEWVRWRDLDLVLDVTARLRELATDLVIEPEIMVGPDFFTGFHFFGVVLGARAGAGVWKGTWTPMFLASFGVTY